MSDTPDRLEDIVAGSGRHSLFRLARIARAGGLSAPAVADAIEKILGNDMRRIEKAMDAARSETPANRYSGNAAARSAPREDDSGASSK